MKSWNIVIPLVLIICASFFSYRCGRKAAESRVKERIDTLVIREPYTQIKPQYIASTITGWMFVPMPDTLHVNDSVFVQLPREQQVYEDSCYRAVISGFRPSLDSITVFNTTKIVTRTITQSAPRLSFGLAAGPSVVYGNGIHAGIGVTAGVVWRF